jgi:hypothetical protein
MLNSIIKTAFSFRFFQNVACIGGIYYMSMIWGSDLKKKYNCSVLSVASHIKNYYNKILIVKNALILNLTITIRVKKIISNTKQRLCQKS